MITTETDLDRLFAGELDHKLIGPLTSRLQTAASLEEAIEHLEHLARTASTHHTAEDPTIIWLAAPGEDADVVHETIRLWPSDRLTTLLAGPWPYGPTHVVEADGPRPLLRCPINMLSVRQAISVLCPRILGFSASTLT
ncbi:hypothetical protein [Actinomadura xylanilytica]|uniref:hypothetical protein n=1 Tax=Actinomadura xylanilytica TaxID=887459 RepID=UPI00255B3560|nr:hypothetical protein [Actinomadura xylanilytica]MDL4770692.1 hypothetical protein [Actinomadura xylanilytica]